jgi:uracil-DNA glycosylase family 4
VRDEYVLSPVPEAEPPRDCPLCPRLVAYREELRLAYPDWWNAPVPAWGDPDAWLAVVGMAPGKSGANRTGRPFTGDFAGELLYATLAKFGLAEGRFDARVDDGFTLRGVAIVNALRCVPPQNKPKPAEAANCRPFYAATLAGLPNVRVLVALGAISHASVVRAAGAKQSAHPFGHAREHCLPDGRLLIDSYHTSRYNQNTGVLTPAMFEAVIGRAQRMRVAPA